MKNVKPVIKEETVEKAKIAHNYVLNIMVKADKPEAYKFLRQLVFNTNIPECSLKKFIDPNNYAIEKYYEARELAYENYVDCQENYMNVASAAELRDMLDIAQFNNCIEDFENVIKDRIINDAPRYKSFELSSISILNFLPDLINVERLSHREIRETVDSKHKEYAFQNSLDLKYYYHKGELYLVLTTRKGVPSGDRLEFFKSIIKTYPELEFHIIESASLDTYAYREAIKAKADIEDDTTDFHIIYSAEGSNEITKFTSLSDVDEDTYAEKISYWDFRISNGDFSLCNNPDCGLLIPQQYGDKCPCCGKKKFGFSTIHGCDDKLKHEFPLAIDMVNSVGSSYKYYRTGRILDENGELIEDGTVQ